MRTINLFIDHTFKWVLIIFGLVTCGTLPIALNIETITPLFGGVVDFTASSAPPCASLGFRDFLRGCFNDCVLFSTMVAFRNHVTQRGRKKALLSICL